MTQHAWLDRWSLRRVARGGSDGGGGTGWQMNSSTSNSRSVSGANPGISSWLQGIAGTAYDKYASMPASGIPYPETTLAPQSDVTKAVLEGMVRYGNRGLGGGEMENALRNSLTSTMRGDNLDIANNPYWQEGLAASFRPQTEQLRDITMPSIDAKFAGSGRYGSGAHALTTSQAISDLSQAQADASAKTASELYQSERDRQMQALGMAPMVQQMDLNRIGLQAQAGQAMDAYSQAQINDANARMAYQYTGPIDWEVRNALALQGIVPGGETIGQGGSQGSTWGYQPGSGGGGVGSWIGGGLGLAGLGLQAYGSGLFSGGAAAAAPMLMASDRRLKTDIEPLGIDPLTGEKMYAYRYKSDPKSYPKVVGPMAQDIEKAGGPVREIGGHKVVGLM